MNQNVPYHYQSEDTPQEVNEKLAFAIRQAQTFAPNVRPALIKANQYWTREVERLKHKLNYLNND